MKTTTPRRAVPSVFVAFVLIASAAALIWKSHRHEDTIHGSAMGTRWTLQWRGASPPPRELRNEVSAILETWEQVLSQWRPGSDLSRYNCGEPPTHELSRVLTMADEMKHVTKGAFDHHILEKVHAAGFGPQGSGVDLSSIGKGFAVDRVCGRLRQLGMNDFVFALAGEVRAVGEWQVEIEKPLLSGYEMDHVIQLKNQAVATSGNYRQFRETKAGLVSHIIDPRTGQPVIRPPSSVTVIAGDCATASAWATALFVLGPEFKDHPRELKVSWQHP